MSEIPLPPSPPPPWPGAAVPPPPPRPRGSGFLATFIAAFTAVTVVGAAYFGYRIAARPSGTSAGISRTRDVSQPVDDNSRAIAKRLDDSIVNITTSLVTGERAAGTGIIISSDGLVLTNNHVIAQSTSIVTENSATGSFAPATVLGYDVANDVALIKITGASHLRAAPIGDASAVASGDSVVALGNAGGQGGAPSVAPGTVTALGRRITATDASGEDAETLVGMIQVDASVQPGDSGGPLANSRGEVIGIDAAASDPRVRFGFQDGAATEGFAIPIQRALTIAKAIRSGRATGTIHVGAHRGIIGVSVRDNASVDGALVVGVQSGSAADDAGMSEGDVIVAVNGTTIGSATDLTHALAATGPGARIRLQWVTDAGDRHQATIRLGSGPPA